MKCTKDPSVLPNSMVKTKDRFNVRMTSDVNVLPQIVSSQCGHMGNKIGLSFQLEGRGRGQRKDREQEALGGKGVMSSVNTISVGEEGKISQGGTLRKLTCIVQNFFVCLNNLTLDFFQSFFYLFKSDFKKNIFSTCKIIHANYKSNN